MENDALYPTNWEAFYNELSDSLKITDCSYFDTDSVHNQYVIMNLTLLSKRASVFLNQILSRSISGLVNVSKHHLEWAIEEVNAYVVFLNFGYWWYLPHLANGFEAVPGALRD